MAQIGWVYASPTRRQYKIGLYHGDRTRHVLLHINNKISVVDFFVRENKTYSFFIEDELCELSMKRGTQNWSYDFMINTEVNTPANIMRRKIERRHLLYSIAVLLLLVVVVIVLISTIFTS